jgi:hypothetical protein
MGNKKYLLLFVSVAVVIAATIFYQQYSKQPVDVKDATAIAVAAPALYADFAKDSTAAKKYLQKILAVSGTVTRISQNQQAQTILMLKTASEAAFINCTLEGPAGKLKAGDECTIKGICTGLGEGDADLGIPGDVYLVRCYVTGDEKK